MSLGTHVLAWLLLATAPAQVDGPVHQIGRRTFRIPVVIGPEYRAQLRELILFASDDQGKTWQQVASAGPDKDFFPFTAAADGLYWFTVVAVDQQGKRYPENVKTVPPSQKIVVDTVKPVVKLSSAERQGDEILVSWEIQEENADLTSLRLEFRPVEAPASTLWQPVAVTPGPTGQARFRPNHGGAVAIRLEVKDLAGNGGTTEQIVPPAPVAVQPPPAVPLVRATAQPVPEQPIPISPLGGSGYPPPVQQLTQAQPPHSYIPPGATYHQPGYPGSDPAPLPHGPLPPAQIVNDPQISLDYEVKAGKSGVARVELWLTEDDGRSWKFYADDPDRHSPLQVALPGEGVFGLKLVVVSGANLTKGPPVPGDLPDLRIEVDTTPPAIELLEPRPNIQRKDTLTIVWNAVDNRTLAPRPITLEWAERPEGPWSLIAADQPNTGTYYWQLPPQVPYRLYLRASAVDAAGNRSSTVWGREIIADLQKPEAKLLGLSTIRQAGAVQPMPTVPVGRQPEQSGTWQRPPVEQPASYVPPARQQVEQPMPLAQPIRQLEQAAPPIRQPEQAVPPVRQPQEQVLPITPVGVQPQEPMPLRGPE